MPRVQTKRSTPKLSEVARHVNVPSGTLTTAWPSVRDRCLRFGIEFDEWQHGIGQIALGKRADGRYAASVGGVLLSIPRQTGKTYLIGWLVFALCTLYPNLTVIWTAHHSRTSDETFDKMRSMANRPRVRKYIAGRPRVANGQQEIEFVNGSRILFGAREHGFGRGFDMVDVLILDEAQKLSENAMSDMVPATNAAPNGLVFLMGTPPRPQDSGSVFASRRDDAIAGDTETAFVEFSADSDAEIIDWAQLAKANPSYPHRTSKTAVLRMQKLIGSDADFRREAYGIWEASARQTPVINPTDWAALTRPAPDGAISCIAVKFAPDGSRQAVIVSTATEDAAFVEAIPILTGSSSIGMSAIADWIAERADSVDAIVIDGKSGAGALNDALLDLGVRHRKIIRPTLEQIYAANTGLLESVRDATVAHAAQPGVVASVAGSTRRTIGTQGGWGFAPIGSDDDETPIEAIAFAVHWTGGARHKNGKRRSGRAVFA